jgi:hypothetical protein
MYKYSVRRLGFGTFFLDLFLMLDFWDLDQLEVYHFGL